MASLVLGAAGAALGGSLFGSGFSILGATLTGAQIGGALGAVAGSVVDSALFASRSKVKGARSDVSITASTEGAVIPRLYGRQRVSGQLIWATRFKEKEKKETTGGKGGGVTTTTYTYSISVAVALCEGPISRIDRIWADGNEMDLEDVTYRIYLGSEDQAADPLVAEMEGADNAPAFRGTAYIVFEHLALADFGNRIPQFQFEVIRAIGAEHPGTLETMARAVTLIPGAGEFVYGTTAVTRTVDGNSDTENKINPTDETDIVFALDQLHAILPNVETVALVVGWFGTDLRAGSCRIVPGVEVAGKSTSPYAWSVAGVGRAEAHVVSHDDEDNPLYGGTPADRAVTEALAELKRRGLKVIFYPFVFMDIRDGNGLPDPYGEAEQKPFPWRGRITADIAPGLSGSADKTSAISADIDAFFDGEWGFKRFIRHYADLCAEAGGVDAFLIGSEMVGITTLRDSASSYPAVAKLRELAADVRGIVGADTKIGYGADWSEYFGHHPADGSGDVFFHLDPLWADDNIDFVGIDNYMPLADWRDGEDHRDWQPMRRISDRDYLQSNIEGGEGFDWYYASSADRDAQNRAAITDGGAGKPWVFRFKDIRSWWSNPHYDRPGGVENGTATAWVPQSKPIWFTELGCPAADKGPNQPNVFVDPKSSESAFPYYSNGWRDDLAQRAFLEAQLSYWDASAGHNPVSSVYGGPMLDTDRICIWTWDARPFPFYPSSSDFWRDTPNWTYGHWLNGRAGLAPLDLVIADILSRQDFTRFDTDELAGLVTGYVLDDAPSARDAIEALGTAFFFDGVESEGQIVFRRRDRPSVVSYAEDDLAVTASDSSDGTVAAAFQLTRAQETDLPLSVRLSYTDAASDYRSANAYGRRLSSQSARVTSTSVPFVMEQADAIGLAEAMLIEAYVKREAGTLSLPPSALALEPGDVADFTLGGRDWRLRVSTISDAAQRDLEAERTDRSVYQLKPGALRDYGPTGGGA